MRFIPYTQLAVILVALSLVTSGLLYQFPESNLVDNLNGDETTLPTTDTSVPTGSFEGNSTNITNVDVADDIQYDQPERVANQEVIQDPIPSYPVVTLFQLILVYFGIIFVIGVGYRSYLNLPQVQRVVNTALRLSSFATKISARGRQWTVDDIFILQINYSDPHFTMILPETGKDPQEYGFATQPQIQVSCDENQLQLTLLAVKSYLKD